MYVLFLPRIRTTTEAQRNWPLPQNTSPTGTHSPQTRNTTQHGPSRFQAYDLSTERYARQCIVIVLLKLSLFGLQVLGGQLTLGWKDCNLWQLFVHGHGTTKTSGCAAPSAECLHLLKHFFKGGKVKGPFRKTLVQETNSPPSMPFHSHFHHA